MAKRKAKTPSRVKTQRAAASKLNIDERQLRRWMKETWFPADGKSADGFDVGSIAAARDAMGRKGSAEAKAARDLKLQTDRERLKQAELKTKAAQLQLRQTEGELIERDAVELHFALMLTQLGDWCDQLPELIAADVPKSHRAKIRNRLKSELDRRRRELQSELKRAAAEFNTSRSEE